MSRPDDDEEALRWGNDSDPTYTETPVAEKRRSREPSSETGEDAVEATPSYLLVTYGIIAGVYLLYTVGWVFVVTRTVRASPDLLGTIMFQFGQFMAIAAAPLWFFAAFVLTRGRQPIVRLSWLLLGIVLLVPLPFILGV